MTQSLTLQILLNFKKYIKKIFPYTLGYLINGELLIVVPSNKILNILKFLKNHSHSRFQSLSDITGADFHYKKNRFEVTYNLISYIYNVRISILTYVDELNFIDSIVNIYKNANWFEREVWDMLGVYFHNNKDLRRILTDYGFKGHPLRKDFPVTGYVEVRYDELQKRVITEKASFAQDFRDFSFNSNWLN